MPRGNTYAVRSRSIASVFGLSGEGDDLPVRRYLPGGKLNSLRGLTAAGARGLSEAGISCNVVAAGHHNHLFVRIDESERALEALRHLRPGPHHRRARHGHAGEGADARRAPDLLVVRPTEQPERDQRLSRDGRGASLHGVARGLRARRPTMHVAAVEPAESAVWSGQPGGSHTIEGIGIGFVRPCGSPTKPTKS